MYRPYEISIGIINATIDINKIKYNCFDLDNNMSNNSNNNDIV